MPFEFGPDKEAQLASISARFGDSRAAILHALWMVQSSEGYVSDSSIEEISRILNLPTAEVYGVATFYTMFARQKRAKHTVRVCTNICCWLRGSKEVLAHIEKRLGIRPNEVTPDGRIFLETVECLGACGGAPAMMVDSDYFEELTPQRIDEILGGLN